MESLEGFQSNCFFERKTTPSYSAPERGMTPAASSCGRKDPRICYALESRRQSSFQALSKGSEPEGHTSAR
ncbi:MAG: hypothetical protein IPK13_06850 [Deltaproteobacteria bacterium]|nr:hypothetical protein [Deltaproteobacteria bacterium]